MEKFSAEKKLSQVLERGLESCEGWWKTFRAFAITLKKTVHVYGVCICLERY